MEYNTAVEIEIQLINRLTFFRVDMQNWKYVYYGFGAFIGFVCGLLIQMIFMLLESSGAFRLGDLVENHGAAGKVVIFLVEGVPYMGVVLGLVLVQYLFVGASEKDGGGAAQDD